MADRNPMREDARGGYSPEYGMSHDNSYGNAPDQDSVEGFRDNYQGNYQENYGNDYQGDQAQSDYGYPSEYSGDYVQEYDGPASEPYAGPQSSPYPRGDGTSRVVNFDPMTGEPVRRPQGNPTRVVLSTDPVDAELSDGQPPVGMAPVVGRVRGRATPDDGSKLTISRRLFFVVVLVAAALGCVVMALTSLLSRCSSGQGTSGDTSGAGGTGGTAGTDSWTSPYDWSNLRKDANGLYSYYVDGVKVSETGIDVSEHDGEVDWATVKSFGIDFAMIRIGRRGYSVGTMSVDPMFESNIAGAMAAGLKVGVYFFSQAIDEAEAREEAQFVLDTLSNAGITELDYPVAFDEELITNGDSSRTEGISSTQLVRNTVAFCTAIQQAGFKTIVYGNKSYFNRLDFSGDLSKYDIWYAEYGTSTPTGRFNFSMWQYTDTATVQGLHPERGEGDVSICFLANA